MFHANHFLCPNDQKTLVPSEYLKTVHQAHDAVKTYQ